MSVKFANTHLINIRKPINSPYINRVSCGSHDTALFHTLREEHQVSSSKIKPSKLLPRTTAKAKSRFAFQQTNG